MESDSKIGSYVRDAERSKSEESIWSEWMSKPMQKFDPQKEAARVGLCASCKHVQRVTSDRGSKFYRCGKAANDPRFAKYPRLPVLQCAGYEVTGDCQ